MNAHVYRTFDCKRVYLREARLIYTEVEAGKVESHWYFWWDNLSGSLGDYVEIGVRMDGKTWRMPSM